jgi:hypothetical protein
MSKVEKLGIALEARFRLRSDDIERPLLGHFRVESYEREIRIFNEQDRNVAALMRAVGATDARNDGSGGRI